MVAFGRQINRTSFAKSFWVARGLVMQEACASNMALRRDPASDGANLDLVLNVN